MGKDLLHLAFWWVQAVKRAADSKHKLHHNELPDELISPKGNKDTGARLLPAFFKRLWKMCTNDHASVQCMQKKLLLILILLSTYVDIYINKHNLPFQE